MLKDKVALVTGAGRGIGRAIALSYAQNGAHVAIVYGHDESAAIHTQQQAQAFGVTARCYACDVSDAQQVKQTFAAVLSDFGRVDILVNNAGVTRDGLLPQLSEAAFDEVLNVNLKGAFFMTQQAYRAFVRQRSGRIVNISSIAGVCGNAGQANYACAKAGLIGLTKTTAKELSGRNVTCNAIAPGLIETDMTAAMPEKARQALLQNVPLRRMGTPEEVAALAVYLASDAAAYMTGQVLCLDGGMTM